MLIFWGGGEEMHNRTTQRLANRNVNRYFAVEQKAREEHLPEKPLLMTAANGKEGRSSWTPWTGLVALIMQLLALIGL